ncbi:MAG: uncharacterized protein K0Q97_1248 [Bacillota bacterium]|jgi:HlyD family secretion protein|nr:uncharacterized protein [Bacillota bacterium]
MKKKKIIILSVIIIIIALLAFSFAKKQNAADENTTKVELGTIQKTVDETGTVYSKKVNTFYSNMSQKVDKLSVSIGDRVKKGDIILTYENNYDLEIKSLQKQIDSITASYNEASRGADFQEVSNAKLTINTIENNLDLALSSFEKINQLYQDGAVSKVEYEEADNKVKILQNQLQEAKNNYELLLKGVSNNIKTQYEAQVEEIMVQMQILQKKQEQATIKAEFDGIITELNVEEKSMTQLGEIVVEIQDDSSLGIYVELLADEASEVKTDMKFVVLEQNSDDMDDIIEELKVNRIHPKALSKISDLGVEQKRVRVEADILENKNKLRIGTEVDVKIILEQHDGVLLLQKDAVYEKNEKKYVTIKKGEQLQEQEITTNLENDKYYEITSGLSENDVVLIEKNED